MGGHPLGGRSACSLTKKRAFVNHYSFDVMDPEWGHMTIKMSWHPPFGAQIILNGHEYVAATACASGIRYVKEGNCFTRIADPPALAQIADTLSQPATIGRLTQVCDRWIYTACLCFDRFTTTLDCVDHTFIGDDLLDRLPTPTQLGATRVGGIDLNKPPSGPHSPRSLPCPSRRAGSPSPSSPPRSTR